MSEPGPKPRLGKLAFTLDPEKLDESVREMASKLKQTVDTTRYSKVRLSYKGKPLMADIPLGLFVAGEAASLWWAGPLRLILVNLGIGSLIDVELRHDADEVLRKGQELFLEGEVDQAEEAYRKALKMRPGDSSACYNLAVLLRVTGRRREAVEYFELAAQDEDHPDGTKARKTLDKMNRGGKTL
jgi:tetratricopeptide (TPR) repeat protein